MLRLFFDLFGNWLFSQYKSFFCILNKRYLENRNMAVPTFLKRILILIALMATTLSAQQPQTILSLPWGTADTQAGFRKAPEAYYGPQAFQIRNGAIWLLDSPNHALKKFKNGSFVQKIAIPFFADDFYLTTPDHYVLLSDNTVYVFKDGRVSALYRPADPTTTIEQLQSPDDRQILLRFSDGKTRIFEPQSQKIMALQSNQALATWNIHLRRKNGGTAEIRIGNTSSFTLHFPENNLASLRLIGRDAQGRLYINFEFFKQQVPLLVERRIMVFTPQGQKLLTLQVPVNNYTQIFRDTYLQADGKLFQMRTHKTGLEIVVWDLAPYFNAQNPPLLRYPDRFWQGLQYNFLLTPDSAQNHLLKATAFEDYPQVIAHDALTVAQNYVELAWTCLPENITNGVVYDDQGYPVRTPDWVTVGEDQHVPYKWGGFEDIEMFLNGLDILKYAGDNYTSKCCGSDAAVGVDCSGFVSRCWNLPKHYSTSMMDDALTKPYMNWSDLQPADAVHKVGHVRLMVKQNGNGSLTVAEASGKDWKVSYRTYYYGDLSAYTPRYYVNREGAPGNIPQPRLDRVTFNTHSEVYWDVGGLNNIRTLQLFTSSDGVSWNTPVDIPKDSVHFSDTLNNGQVVYYRLASISQADGQQGPYSDAYGVYRNDNKVKVLIVDGFDRTTATNGAWPKIYHTFAATLGQALKHSEIPFESVDNKAVIEHRVYLGDYPAVFWILGDESTHDGTFNKDEQELVREYLQNGGMLFVSGSEIGWDLSHLGTRYDYDFYSNYLKAEYVSDDAATYLAHGNDGTPFAGLTLHFDDGTHGTYNVKYPDVIKPLNGSLSGFTYDNGGSAGVYFSGSFSGGSKQGKLVYMAFPFETIYTESERNALMAKIVDFFGLNNLSSLKDENRLTAQAFALFGNSPNPFNSQTQIRFQTPAKGQVILQVFNSLGQMVYSRLIHLTESGEHKFRFDGAGLPSGLYFYRLRFQSAKHAQIRNGKMVLIK